MRGRQMHGCKRGHYTRVREVKRFTTPVACGLGQVGSLASDVAEDDVRKSEWKVAKRKGTGPLRLTIRGHRDVARLAVGKFIMRFLTDARGAEPNGRLRAFDPKCTPAGGRHGEREKLISCGLANWVRCTRTVVRGSSRGRKLNIVGARERDASRSADDQVLSITWRRHNSKLRKMHLARDIWQMTRANFSVTWLKRYFCISTLLISRKIIITIISNLSSMWILKCGSGKIDEWLYSRRNVKCDRIINRD